MKKINLALISDALFYTLCAFLVGFCAIRFFFKSVVVAVIVAASIAVAVCLLSLYSLVKRRQKLIATTAMDGNRKQLALYLATLAPKEAALLFANALNGTYTAGNVVEDEENEYHFLFKIAPLNCDDIAAVLQNRGGKKVVLLCNTLAPEAADFAKEFGVKVKCIGELYDLLKQSDLLPEQYAFGGLVKKGAFKKIKLRFNRKLCPSLFFSGFFLLLYSFFSFYPVWYVVTGSILTVLSAVCLFFGQSKD